MATTCSDSTALAAVQWGLTASQAEEEEEQDDTSQEVFYGCADLMIVGCRYYSGVAHLGEFVNLVREPRNPYDRNAIRVDNLASQQVGHIKATQASVLARVLDDRRPLAPRVEAVVSVGGQRVYNLPIRVHVYGPPEGAAAAIAALRGVCLKGGMTGKPGPSAAGVTATGDGGSSVTVTTTIMNPIKTQRELDEMFDKLDADTPQLLTEEASAKTTLVLATTLMQHQAEGLAWMLQRENKPDPTGLPPFWERRVEGGKSVFYNTITCSSLPVQPASVHGGILSDDMGLGKTLQVISLIVAQQPQGVSYVERVRAVEQNKRVLEELEAKEQAAQRGETLALPPQQPKEEYGEGKPAPVAAPTSEEQKEQARLEAAKVYRKLKKPDLKAMLKTKGLSEKGVKDELVTRLARHDAGMPSLDEPTQKEGVAAGEGAGAGGGGGGGAGGPIGTLVVCPMSVLSNWETQLEEHVKGGALKVYAYHGGNRSQDVDFLASCDVVITTYDTLASDFTASGGEEAFLDAGAAAGDKRKRRHGVMSLGWHRVVLDEAHIIRNDKTRKHKACLALSSRYRWCLTGTPLQNKAEDIGALFSFLRMAPVSDKSVFTRAIGRPIRSGDDAGLASLRVLMKSVCLRRTKTILGDRLPPKVVEVHSVEMDECHREAYNALYDSARAAFKVALAVGVSEVMSQYASVLECLLRLRQVCCATSLVPDGRLEQAKKVLNQLAEEEPKLGKEEAAKLFAKLKGLLEQEEGAECAVCLEPVREADVRVLRGCGHGFCHKCLGAMRAAAGGGIGSGGGGGGRDTKCPLCRTNFSSSDVIGGAELETAGGSKQQEEEEEEKEEKARKAVGMGMGTPPPKVAALLQSLHELRKSGDDKVVIFSQFVSFLNVLQPFLVANGYRLARLDGSMTNKKRQVELQRFAGKGEDSAEVMLASLMAAGTGINLTSANHCFICDPWWNASVEEQAMDRVHRIGQTKPVRVVRMVSADSVETRILEIQEAKQALGRGVLRKLSADEIRKSRVTDLRTIFEC